MRDYDFLRIVGATILAAGVAVMSQDPSSRILSALIESPAADFRYHEFMRLLRQDPLGDKATQFKVDLKRQWANFTDDDLSGIDGDSDRFLDTVHQRYGDRTDELKQWVVDWFDKSTKTGPATSSG